MASCGAMECGAMHRLKSIYYVCGRKYKTIQDESISLDTRGITDFDAFSIISRSPRRRWIKSYTFSSRWKPECFLTPVFFLPVLFCFCFVLFVCLFFFVFLVWYQPSKRDFCDFIVPGKEGKTSKILVDYLQRTPIIYFCFVFFCFCFCFFCFTSFKR